MYSIDILDTLIISDITLTDMGHIIDLYNDWLDLNVEHGMYSWDWSTDSCLTFNNDADALAFKLRFRV